MSKVKICGLRRLEDIEVVNKYKPDYIGFVFATSKRQISLEQAKLLKQHLDKTIKAVGVFVNEPIDSICKCVESGAIDYIQLHGDEDREYIIRLKRVVDVPVIKAVRVADKKQLCLALETLEWLPIDYYLFDTYNKEQYGGSGESFQWQMLKELEGSQIQKPYFLAGGIGSHNLKEALSYKPYAVDLSSKVETDGFKDEIKIKEVMEIIKKY